MLVATVFISDNETAQKEEGQQTCDPGFGVLHFLMLHTVLNEKLILPHFGHVQSLSRVASTPKKKGRIGVRQVKELPFQSSMLMHI